ncbi:MAG TPA: ABC transporter substrate-binding protein [Alphaproteobacteria bacterium]|nr:ABC transporter substrate-binding protein [Alphaproteobacteria bacterium]
MNRTILALGALCALAASSSTHAEDKTLYVAAYGGSFEQTMRKDIFPPFERKYGLKIEYVAGNSTDNLAKLQAQKDNQQIDVAILDDGPMYQAVALGFCAPLAAAPVYGELYDLAKFSSGKAVMLGINATGIMYNKKAFDENHWPAPVSWAELKDPKFKGKLVIPPLNNTYGLHALVVYAKEGGGGEKNIEPGFKAFKETIGPNVLVYEPSPGKMTELFQSGQAVVAIWGSGREKALADTGLPVAFVYPKEGAIALGVAGCAVAGGKNKPEAQSFLQYLLSPEMQLVMAEGFGLGPVNKQATLPPEKQAGIPYGLEQIGKLVVIDWDTVNQNREDWNKRWVREIER